MIRPLLAFAGAAALLAGAAPSGAAPAARKPAPRAAAARPGLDPAQVAAQLRKDEETVRTARLSVTAVRRQGPLPAGVTGPAAWDAAKKLPAESQRKESLLVSGTAWKRDITVMDDQGAPTAHLVAGSSHRNGRMLQETGHGDKKALNGVVGIELDSDDHRLLMTPALELLQGVKWKSARRVGGQIVLTGTQDGTPVTAAIRTAPRYALERLSAEETLVTPQGKLSRGSMVRVTYDAKDGRITPKTIERIDYARAPINQLMLTAYTVDSAQVNTPLPDSELEIPFPQGTRVVDRRVDPPVRYVQGEKDLSVAEVKELAQKQGAVTAKVGGAAPALELKALSGDTVKLADQKGKVVLLTFFASWCPPCNAEAPRMEKEIWQKYRERGLSVLGIDTAERDEPEKMARQFVQQHRTTYPTLLDLDGAVAEAYRVEALPTVVLIDRAGVVRYVQAGFDEPGVIKLLESLLAEKP